MARTSRLTTLKVTPKKDEADTAPGKQIKPVAAKPAAAKDVRTSRVWYGADKMRTAFYAGQGKSGDEIATIVGGTTGKRIRALLNAHGIPLMRNSGVEDILFIRWKRDDRAALDAAALRRDRDPAELAALIVRKVLAGGDRAIDALVDDLDTVG